jgi:hypothetical protein
MTMSSQMTIKKTNPSDQTLPLDPLFQNLQVYEKRNDLKSTVDLRVCHVLGVASPGIALRVEGSLVGQADRVLCLDELNTKTLRNVPCNVAMHEPDSRVVCWEGDEQPTQTGKDGSVATGRVGKVETCGARVKDAGA